MIFDFNRGFEGRAPIGRNIKPLVAISANIIDSNSALRHDYSRALIEAGAVPLIVPVDCDAEAIASLMQSVDGLLLSGGADIDAEYFGEENIGGGLCEIVAERDYNEFMLLRAALDRGVPVLGICRGFQVINIAMGGNIYQDLPSQYPVALLPHSVLDGELHLGVHDVEIVEGSILYNIVGQGRISVNSRHHQAVKCVAPNLRAVAHSADGVVEAIEGYPQLKVMGVQWHPENMAASGGDRAMKRLFGHFVAEAQLYHAAREIMERGVVVDSHCDTPMLYETEGFDFAIRNHAAKVDAPKMEEGGVDCSIIVAYIPQSTETELATAKAVDILERFKCESASVVDIVTSQEGIVKAKKRGRRSVMLGVENGLAVGDDLANIDRFAAMGVVYITLCHNGSNAICDSAAGEQPYDGVSDFGREVIARMNQLGVTVDVSHSSHKTTMDAVALSSQPVIASHSSCKALCDHRRNLSDEAIVAIAESGGVVQVCGYGGFLASGRSASIVDLIDHIEYVVELTGYDHVGVGSDFDGDGGVVGFDGANEFRNIAVELLRRGHSAEAITKILGGNILRVLEQNRSVLC